MKVFVYFNLHRHCFSVRAQEGPNKGRVIAHAKAVQLQDARFKVSEAGRQRVLREQAKNVHAGVVGQLQAHWPVDSQEFPSTPQDWRGVTYDPYRFSSFVDKESLTPVHEADQVLLANKRVFVPRTEQACVA